MYSFIGDWADTLNWTELYASPSNWSTGVPCSFRVNPLHKTNNVHVIKNKTLYPCTDKSMASSPNIYLPTFKILSVAYSAGNLQWSDHYNFQARAFTIWNILPSYAHGTVLRWKGERTVKRKWEEFRREKKCRVLCSLKRCLTRVYLGGLRFGPFGGEKRLY